MKRFVFLHPNVKCLDDFFDYTKINRDKLATEIVWDEVEPDVVFSTEHMYTSKKWFTKFKKLYGKGNRIYVYYGAEASYPDLNIFDYAFVWGNKDLDDGRIFLIPTTLFNKLAMLEPRNKFTKEDAVRKLQDNIGFCNFIYSNPSAHFMRDKLFYKISEYKPVDSLGSHLNNTNIASSRDDTNWMKISIEQKSKYKFSITSENAFHDGYTSEKILTSFQAHTIPIYWGNPRISELFNEDAFINCHKYSSMESIIDEIERIDADDSLWISKVTAPWQTEKQVMLEKNKIKLYQSMFEQLLLNDNSVLICRPSGTWNDFYVTWALRNFNPNSMIARVKRFIKRRFL